MNKYRILAVILGIVMSINIMFGYSLDIYAENVVEINFDDEKTEDNENVEEIIINEIEDNVINEGEKLKELVNTDEENMEVMEEGIGEDCGIEEEQQADTILDDVFDSQSEDLAENGFVKYWRKSQYYGTGWFDIEEGKNESDYDRILKLSSDGTLILKGEYDDDQNGINVAYGLHKYLGDSHVKSVVLDIKTKMNGSLTNLFKSCVNLESIYFRNCQIIVKGEYSNWGNTFQGSMMGMFEDCTNLKEVDFSGIKWIEEGEKVYHIDLSRLFYNCISLEEIDLGNIRFGQVNYVDDLFNGCKNLKTVKGINGINITDLTSCDRMFMGCSRISDIDMSNLTTDTDQIISVTQMFEGCSNLESVQISARNRDGVKSALNVKNFVATFKDCIKIQKLNLSSLVINPTSEDSREDYKTAFSGCVGLTELSTPELKADVSVHLDDNIARMWREKGTKESQAWVRLGCPRCDYKGTVLASSCPAGIEIELYNHSFDKEIVVPYSGIACVNLWMKSDNNPDGVPLIDVWDVESTLLDTDFLYKVDRLEGVSKISDFTDADGFVHDYYFEYGQSDSIGFLQLKSCSLINDGSEDKSVTWKPDIYIIPKGSDIASHSDILWELPEDYAPRKAEIDVTAKIIVQPLQFKKETLLTTVFSVKGTLDKGKWKSKMTSEDEKNMRYNLKKEGFTDVYIEREVNSRKRLDDIFSAKCSEVSGEATIKAEVGQYLLITEEYYGGKRDLTIEIGSSRGFSGDLEGEIYGASLSVGDAIKASAQFFGAEVKVQPKWKNGEIFYIKDFDAKDKEDLAELGNILLYYYAIVYYNAKINQFEPFTNKIESFSIDENFSLNVLRAKLDMPFKDLDGSVIKINQNSFLEGKDIYFEGELDNEYSFKYNSSLGGLIGTWNWLKDQVDMSINYTIKRKNIENNNADNITIKTDYFNENSLDGLEKYLEITPNEEGKEYLLSTLDKDKYPEYYDEKKGENIDLAKSVEKAYRTRDHFSANDVANILNSDVTATFSDYYKWYEKSEPVDWTILKDVVADSFGETKIGLDIISTGIVTSSCVVQQGETYMTSDGKRLYLDDYNGVADFGISNDIINFNSGIKYKVDEVSYNFNENIIPEALVAAGHIVTANIQDVSNSGGNTYANVDKNIKEITGNTISVWIGKYIKNKKTKNNIDPVYNTILTYNAYGLDELKQNIATSVGEPYIVKFVDESGETIYEVPQNVINLTIKYDDSSLQYSGLSENDVNGLAIYKFSRQYNCYVRIDSTVNSETKEVSAMITNPGEYIIGYDTAAPMITNLFVYDNDYPKVVAYFKGIATRFESFILKIDDEVAVDEKTVEALFDNHESRFEYVIDKSLSEGEHTISIFATNECGNSMKEVYSHKWMHYQSDSPQVMYSSLSLNGRIGVNSYIKLPSRLIDDNGAYVLVADQKYYIRDMSTTLIENEELYLFTGYVNAKEMDKDIIFEVYTGNGKKCILRNSVGEEFENSQYAFSVNSYLKKLLESDNSFEVSEFVNNMKAYGLYAKRYFECIEPEENVGKPKDIEEDILKKYSANTIGNIDEGLLYIGSSLILADDIQVKHYFRCDDINKYEFKLNGEKVYPQGTGLLICICSDGIPAAELGDDLVLNITCEGEQFILKYSPLSYVSNAISNSKSSDQLKDVVKALYWYHYATKSFLGQR